MRTFTITLYALLLLSTGTSFAQQQPSKHALVIGNSEYSHSRPLRNPKNDSEAIATSLESLGFQVIRRTDATLEELKTGLRELVRAVPEDGVALVYFAGHGVQIKGSNYLIPVEAEMTEEYEVPDETLSMDTILRGLETTGSSLNLLILDCCRDDPFARGWRGSRSSQNGGLTAPSDMPPGMFIAYATSPGRVASDGHGDHSPYTSALLAELESKPESAFEMVFKRVGARVVQSTGGDQEPWTNSKFYGNFTFVTPDQNAQGASPPPLMPTAPSPTPPEQASARPTDLPSRGFYDFGDIFGSTEYDDYNRYSQGLILKKAQNALKDLGHYEGKADGIPGKMTYEAVISWQKSDFRSVSGKLEAPEQAALGIDDIAESSPPTNSAPNPSVSNSSRPQAVSKPKTTGSSTNRTDGDTPDMSTEEFMRRARALR